MAKKRKFKDVPTVQRGDALTIPSKKLNPWAAFAPSNRGSGELGYDDAQLPVGGVSEDRSEESKKAKISNTIAPHERMGKFLKNWAERVQEVLLQLQCKSCVVTHHACNPFHRVEEWDPTLAFWRRRPLYDLGLVVCLGHSGEPCKVSRPPRTMTVVHQNGIDPMSLKFCHCTTDGTLIPDSLQMLQAGLFPGAWDRPETGYTINGLCNYHVLSHQSQIMAMDFVTYLCRLTDAVQPEETKDHHREINTAMREFTFLRVTHRADQVPQVGLKAGSLAMACLCCPQPGKNMAPGWEERLPKDQYLDILFYSVDGNFHQTQKMKPMDPDDFPLTMGAGYFAHEQDFAEYQEKMKVPKKEESTCNKFGAMGYGRYTGQISGMVGLTCSQHMFVIPGGLVDLLKGEGFAWGDFAQLSGLQPWLDVLKMFCRGYDVNCQYDKKFFSRIELFRQNFGHLNSIRHTKFPPTRSLIPKFHGAAHRLWCQIWHSYHYTPGVGMTDGEALERIWAGFNALAIHSREMSAGHRHDIINDFHNDMNVRRMHAMPQYLHDCLKKALMMFSKASDHLDGLEETVEEKLPGQLHIWRQEEVVWEANVLDPSQNGKANNPYVLSQNHGLTEKQLLALMDKKDALLDELEDSDDPDGLQSRCDQFLADVSAWSAVSGAYFAPLVLEAVDLTHAQIAAQSSNAALADFSFPLRDLRNDAGIAAKGLPPARMPRSKCSTWHDIYVITIILPSSYAPIILQQSCMRELVGFELEICKAQAHDAHNDLRTAIIGREAYKVRKARASNKSQVTRATAHIWDVERTVQNTANLYCCTRIALLTLGHTDTDVNLQPLCKEDIVKYTLDAQQRTVGESSEGVSWIWETFTFTDAPIDGLYKNFYNDAMRVHWFHCSALKKCWYEEVQLLREEMARSVRFFGYYRHLWTERAEARDRDDSPGAAAYARKQAHRYVRLIGVCRTQYAGQTNPNDASLQDVFNSDP
ncbi:hypothetical protein C8Q78DRAFT_1081036 [Trametes maxima]|nr:hypothetical protein C8Q78DRAFT_1081036 [Trametes maxima]